MYRRSTVEIRLPAGNDVACAYPVADGREDTASSQPQVLNADASSLARGSSPSPSAPSPPSLRATGDHTRSRSYDGGGGSDRARTIRAWMVAVNGTVDLEA
jgi:hypothetical protein